MRSMLIGAALACALLGLAGCETSGSSEDSNVVVHPPQPGPPILDTNPTTLPPPSETTYRPPRPIPPTETGYTPPPPLETSYQRFLQGPRTRR